MARRGGCTTSGSASRPSRTRCPSANIRLTAVTISEAVAGRQKFANAGGMVPQLVARGEQHTHPGIFHPCHEGKRDTIRVPTGKAARVMSNSMRSAASRASIASTLLSEAFVS